MSDERISALFIFAKRPNLHYEKMQSYQSATETEKTMTYYNLYPTIQERALDVRERQNRDRIRLRALLALQKSVKPTKTSNNQGDPEDNVPIVERMNRRLLELSKMNTSTRKKRKGDL